jgi:hypothetical protein
MAGSVTALVYGDAGIKKKERKCKLAKATKTPRQADDEQ